MYDLVIRNGKIVDGSGEASFMGDIAINGDRIVTVSYTHLTLPTKRIV